jgi:hypothetical protein
LSSFDFLFKLLFNAISSEDFVKDVLQFESSDGVVFNARDNVFKDFLVLNVSLNDALSIFHSKVLEVLLSLLITVDHVSDSLLEHVVFDTEVLFNLALITEES